jgi:hypothetical protein
MTNVYRIGVNLAMTSNSSAVMGVLGRELLGLHGQVGKLEKGFGRLKLAVAGALSIGAGVAILGMFKAPLDEARKFQMEVTKFGNLGLGAFRTNEAAEFAKQMNVTGSTYVDNMKRMTEAQGVFRQAGLSGEAALRGAKMAAPTLAKIDFANAALDSESRARMNTQAMAMMRFVEMRGGVNSPEQFNAIADAGFKAIASSGGNINWELLRQFSAQAGVAGQQLDPEVLFGKFEPIIGELKGKAGTSLMTAYGRLSGAQRLPNQIAHALVDMGVWDGSKIEWNNQGGIKQIRGGAGGLPGNPMRDLQLFQHDPFAFYDKYIRSVYDTKKLPTEERARDNFAIFGRTGGAMFNLYERQHHAVESSVLAQRKALGIDQAYKAAGGTLNGKIIDMQARFTNLLERLGEAVLPLAVKGLDVLVPAITRLTAWVGDHPGQVAAFAKAAVVVSGALIGLGVVAVGLAVFAGGWVPVAIAAAGAVVGGVAAWVTMNWDKLGGAVVAIGKFVMGIARIAADIISGRWLAVGAETQKLISDMTPKAKLPKALLKMFPPGMVTPDGQPVRHPYPMQFPAAPALPPGHAINGGHGWAPASSAVPPPAGPQKISLQGDAYIDGQKAGKVIWRHQAREMDRQVRSSTGSVDPGRTLPPAGLAYV